MTPSSTLTTDPVASDAVLGAIAERMAKELFYADVLFGRATVAAWQQLSADEQGRYLADAWAALRRLDAVASVVAVHRATKAAEKALPIGGLNHLGRQSLKLVVAAALEAHHAHLSGGNDDSELREFERLAGMPESKPLTVIPGGRS